MIFNVTFKGSDAPEFNDWENIFDNDTTAINFIVPAGSESAYAEALAVNNPTITVTINGTAYLNGVVVQ